MLRQLPCESLPLKQFLEPPFALTLLTRLRKKGRGERDFPRHMQQSEARDQ